MPRKQNQFEELILEGNLAGAQAGGQEAFNRVEYGHVFHFVDEQAIAAYREEASKLSRATLDRLRGDLKATVSTGIAEGKPTLQVRNDILEIFDDLATWEGERLARTEIAMGVAQGALRGYQEMLIEVVEYVANMGACPQCEMLAGSLMTLDAANGIIPVHPNCYCYWIPRPDLKIKDVQ